MLIILCYYDCARLNCALFSCGYYKVMLGLVKRAIGICDIAGTVVGFKFRHKKTLTEVSVFSINNVFLN